MSHEENLDPFADSYIMLDVDGVLNGDRFFKSQRAKGERENVKHWDRELRLRYALDPECLARLATILDRCVAAGFDPKIVMSTSWRLHNTVGDFRRAFMFRGFSKEHAARIIDRTPYRWDGDSSNRRGLEIQQWLDQRWGTPSSNAIPRAPRLAIIDDSCDFGHLRPHHVQTDWGFGLRDEHIEPCVKLLTLTTHSNLP